uniref:Uncharacterized protein n=1 Tax=Siphoviridae sp. ctUlD12 TaxID=2826354 RepID=A0A8S5MMK6_9CAUD|nr:MAG TPA: hypothetical protein [Siphoviridae sp. ctUlD12]
MNPPKRRGESDSKQCQGVTCKVLTGRGLSAKGPPGGTRHRVNASVLQNAPFLARSFERAFLFPFHKAPSEKSEVRL